MSKKVFLGVGHGGRDPGASANGLNEKDVNLEIALAAAAELKRHGIEVRLSRTSDVDNPLEERIRMCNAYTPDLAVDCHNNAGGGDGFEAFCRISGGLSRTLAERIESRVKAIGQNSRGVKTRTLSNGQDWYGFVRQVQAPAVLCEFAFLDSPDVSAVASPESRKRMGLALAQGILDTLAPPAETYGVWVAPFTERANAEAAQERIRNELGLWCVVESR